uniref:Platelet endothelial aggregation receptor 1-like isoform X2 n=1 Tax=Crassostrea virginica TaxID=6565 RepID=A0A8B8AXR2_CRAVI|nr:platelet endothelial aggregation receptor 1-like isoform X2 [Crassostrea virginica]
MCTMSFNIFFIVLTFSIQMVHAETLPPLCNRKGKQVCCSGSKRNDTTGLCDKCLPGYTGVGCTIKCSHPYYGDECSSKCDCPQELCDFVLGCEYISTQGFISSNKGILSEVEGTATKNDSPWNASQRSH